MRWQSAPDRVWRKGFALVPVKLDDGTTVWLETFVYRTDGCGRLAIVDRRLKNIPQE